MSKTLVTQFSEEQIKERPGCLLQVYQMQPDEVTRSGVLAYVTKKLETWDWSNCQSRRSVNGRWITSSIDRLDCTLMEYTGYDMEEEGFKNLTCIGVAYRLSGSDIIISAVGIYDINGMFMGFANDSMYSKSLEAFYKQLFRRIDT